MASPKQIAANRRNAARSTGPRTAAGKAKAASNARRHGFTVRVPEAEVAGMMSLILGGITDGPSALTEIDWEATAELARAELDLARIKQFQAHRPELDAAPDPLMQRYRSEAESGRRTAFRAWIATLSDTPRAVAR